jgi:hypothetical protein
MAIEVDALGLNNRVRRMKIFGQGNLLKSWGISLEQISRINGRVWTVQIRPSASTHSVANRILEFFS